VTASLWSPAAASGLSPQDDQALYSPSARSASAIASARAVPISLWTAVKSACRALHSAGSGGTSERRVDSAAERALTRPRTRTPFEPIQLRYFGIADVTNPKWRRASEKPTIEECVSTECKQPRDEP
jgi:hypothetical protein